jgi:hypothetical protein
MVSKQQSKIGRLYQQLRHQAEQQPGVTQRCPLPGGARISLTIEQGWHKLVFSRKGKKLGDSEVIVFRTHCQVPEQALRIPHAPYQTVRHVDGQEWHYVAYVWEE